MISALRPSASRRLWFRVADWRAHRTGKASRLQLGQLICISLRSPVRSYTIQAIDLPCVGECIRTELCRTLSALPRTYMCRRGSSSIWQDPHSLNEAQFDRMRRRQVARLAAHPAALQEESPEDQALQLLLLDVHMYAVRDRQCESQKTMCARNILSSRALHAAECSRQSGCCSTNRCVGDNPDDYRTQSRLPS